MDKKITDSIIYIGVDDKDIDLFESQYVVPYHSNYHIPNMYAPKNKYYIVTGKYSYLTEKLKVLE